MANKRKRSRTKSRSENDTVFHTENDTVSSGGPVSGKVNRAYKDTVFRKLFSDKRNLLALYNALNGTHYTDPDDLEIVTLDSAIYMEVKNDLAFIMDMNLFLWEHQSTYNPNIPLRDLIYIAGEYQRYVNEQNISLYSSLVQRIPAPRFVVFYNGEREIGEYMEHRLSDAYENLIGEPALELKVLVLNINEGHNQALMEQCQVLKEYAAFVARVRKYGKIMKLETAVEKAVTECIQEGILAEFLRENRAEVIGMCIFEYNKEEEERKLRKAEFEYGKAVGERRERKRLLKKLQESDMQKEQIELVKQIILRE